MGANGDFYLDKANFNLYGPKNPKKKNSWGTPINLKGTANVMYSNWIRSPKIWKRGAINGDRLRYFDIAANAITQEVLDQAIVNVYLQTPFGSIHPLPISKGLIPNIDLSIYFDLEPQNLEIAYFDPDDRGTDPGATIITDKFRYVIIPGGVAVSSNLSKEQLKEMSYQEVGQRFGIRD